MTSSSHLRYNLHAHSLQIHWSTVHHISWIFSYFVWSLMLAYPRHHTFLEGCNSIAISYIILLGLIMDFTESGKVRAGVVLWFFLWILPANHNASLIGIYLSTFSFSTSRQFIHVMHRNAPIVFHNGASLPQLYISNNSALIQFSRCNLEPPNHFNSEIT